MVNIIVQLVLKFKSNLDFFVAFSKQSEHSRLYCVYIFKEGCHLLIKKFFCRSPHNN